MEATIWCATRPFRTSLYTRPEMSSRVLSGGLARLALPVLRGGLVLFLATFAAYRIHFNSATAGFLYLICVVLNGLDSSFFAAAIVSVLAVACLDYFFIDPPLTWTVSDPVDIAALASFWITSLVVTRLATKARDETTTARRERQKMERLYESAQRLLALKPAEAERSRVLETFLLVFHLQAACIFDASSAELTTVGESRANLCERTRDAYILGRDFDDSSARMAVRCLLVSGKMLGAIGFEGLDDAPFMATPLAALATAVLERERSFRSAADAAAEARAETLRSAILDALAHEFKTPLATILTAAGGLSEAGPLLSEQAELAELVESEAERLSNLSSRLLRLAKLDRDEVKLRLSPVNLAVAVAGVVDRYARQYPDRQFSFINEAKSDEIIADLELFQLALSQLLDNSCRYSNASSPVKITLEGSQDSLAVVVWNSGSPIPPGEQARVFERFYRGTEARRIASGTGLGLYVSRKIAVAHGGSLDLDQTVPADGVAFRLTIPLPAGGSSRVPRMP